MGFEPVIPSLLGRRLNKYTTKIIMKVVGKYNMNKYWICKAFDQQTLSRSPGDMLPVSTHLTHIIQAETMDHIGCVYSILFILQLYVNDQPNQSKTMKSYWMRLCCTFHLFQRIAHSNRNSGELILDAFIAFVFSINGNEHLNQTENMHSLCVRL